MICVYRKKQGKSRAGSQTYTGAISVSAINLLGDMAYADLDYSGTCQWTNATAMYGTNRKSNLDTKTTSLSVKAVSSFG